MLKKITEYGDGFVLLFKPLSPFLFCLRTKLVFNWRDVCIRFDHYLPIPFLMKGKA